MITGRFALPISSGSAPEPPPSTEGHKVTYYDPFGDVIKIQYVLDGMDATPPTPPTFDLLTFAEWNNPSTGITRDEDIGAIYNTTDGKTYVFATFNPVIGFQPTVFLNKSTTDLLTIDWGDGTTTTSTATGNVSLIKPTLYASEDNYVITIECAGLYRISGSSRIFGTSTYNSAPYKIYIGENVNILNNSTFQSHKQLKYLTIPSSLTGSITANLFYQCFSLNHCSFPTSMNGFIYANCFNSCYALQSVSFPFTLISGIQEAIFANAFSIRSIVFPKNLTTGSAFNTSLFVNCTSLLKLDPPTGLINVLRASAFSGMRSLRSLFIPIGINQLDSNSLSNNTAMEEYIFQSTIPPTMVNTSAFNAIPLSCKIYVPDASVTDYKTATNWAIYADYIYPISTRPI